MCTVLFAQLRAHAARLVASTVAVVIAVGFVIATLVLDETSRATVLRAAGAPYVSVAAVVTSDDGSSLLSVVPAVAAVPGVRSVGPSWTTGVQALVPGRRGPQQFQVEDVATDPALRWQHLSAGTLPSRAGEVAVSDRTGAHVGQVLTVTSHDAEGNTTTAPSTVVGVVDLWGDPTAGLSGRAFVVPEQARRWGAADPSELRVAATPGADPATVLAAVTAALHGRKVTVRSGSGQAEYVATQTFGNALFLTAILLVFGTVAVLVAGLVIANTFNVLLLQRIRELALLRCVGATARQIRRSVLGEALVTGVLASALGVLAGIGLAAAVSALAGSTESPIPLAGVSVPLYAVVTGLVVGTLVTLVAALAPARAATRVAPLAALRPLDQPAVRSTGGLVRMVAGLLLLLAGAGLMAVGVQDSSVLTSLPGGVLSLLGVLLLAQRAVPPVVGAAGRLAARVGGVPARLAASNATRNPRRTAATATALLIGVTLTTAMVVGAESTRITAEADLEAAFPVDVEVSIGNGSIAGLLLGRLLATDGVQAGASLLSAPLQGPGGDTTMVDGVDSAVARRVLRSTARTPLPRPGEVVVPPSVATGWGVRAGDRVVLREGERSARLAVVLGDHASSNPMVTASDLRRLVPSAGVSTLLLKLAPTADQLTVIDDVTGVVETVQPDAQVTGLATERAAVNSVLDTLLLVVTGLLGVAVVIALIGVGNTLALSVVERRQENGLLRALGCTRRQLRGLLAWEAVLVAGVAAVLGVLLGGAYGLIGAASVLGLAGPVLLAVPVLQVAAIVVAATTAGLLASVLPGRSAARISPVAALAA